MAVPTALRFVESLALAYRRVWRASVFSNFLDPVLYLLAMGASLGSLVDAGSSDLGVPYLVWLGPGLLAAQAMQTGVGEGSFPVMAGLKWRKTFLLVMQTPLDPRDLVTSLLIWITLRVAQVSAIYAAVLVVFGVTDIPRALLGTATATLTGVTFAAAMMAYTAGLEDDTGLTNIFRFAVVPLFLFSGTFFPISQLPEYLQTVAKVVPLWHGIDLTRSLMLGIPTTLPWWIQVGYLALLGVAASVWAMARFRRRLVV